MGQITGGIDASKGIMSGAGAAGDFMQSDDMANMFSGNSAM